MFDTIKRVSTFVPNEDNKPEPVARVSVDKQLPLPTSLDEVIADGVITRAGRKIPADHVVGVQLSPDERLLRVTTNHGSTDYDALPLATISGDDMQWICPQVAERGLGIPELTTTELQPVNDALFTAACALFDAGPIVIVPRVATPESRGVWKPLGKALDKWTTDEAQTDTDAIVVLANGIPSSARDAILARDAGARVHICHASTTGTVELLRWAKAQGISITAEVTPHHLLLDDSRLESYDGVYRVNPPLREAHDAAALREAGDVVMAIDDGALAEGGTLWRPHVVGEVAGEARDSLLAVHETLRRELPPGPLAIYEAGGGSTSCRSWTPTSTGRAAWWRTSTSTPTTVANAAPDCKPKREIATATANSKKLLAPIIPAGAATSWGNFHHFAQP